MFSNAIKVKSNTQVKASERKNIRAKILSCYPDLSEDDINSILPNKEVVNSLKIMTHTCHWLRAVDVIVYAIKKRAAFFEFENVLYPTVYTLWKIPELLPSFTTHPPVLSNLMAGADLMIPGVVLNVPEGTEGPSVWGKFEKGHLVSINLTNNKAPVAIGKTYHSSMDTYMAAGRGRCVNVLHVVGDELCSLLTPAIQTIPDLGPPRWLCPEEVTEISETVENVTLDDAVDTNADNTENVLTPVDDSPSQSEEKEFTVADMDALLRYSFLKCLKTEGKKLSLPMLTSNFYKSHILNACPQDKCIDIKKSSYKKVSKFLSEMSKEGFMKIKELTKGVDNVVEICLQHPDVKFFRVDKSDQPRNSSDSQKQTNVVPNIMAMFSITKPTLPIFLAFGIGSGQCISRAGVHKYITEYVKGQSLQNQFDRKLVNLNSVLQEICGTSANCLPWPELFEKVENRLTPAYEMNSSMGTVQCKGKPENIILSVGSRSGNKKVTLVDNLELFGIGLQDFAKLCQHGVAASTSISKPPGKKYEQVLIQGNQVAFVGKLLTEKYHIPKKYIRGLELAVKRK